MKRNKKQKLEYWDLVIPLCMIYFSFLIAFTHFNNNPLEPTFKNAFILFSCSFFFMYGIFAFIRDLKIFGILWILKSWRKLFNNKK